MHWLNKIYIKHLLDASSGNIKQKKYMVHKLKWSVIKISPL